MTNEEIVKEIDALKAALTVHLDALAITLHEVESKTMSLQGRLDQLIASHNEVGQNVAWIVANTQGIFQMFSDPKMMSQLMSSMVGGIGGMGVPNATGPADDSTA